MPPRANASRILHRSLRSSYRAAASGSGSTIVDESGRRYLDASGGAAVSCLGHGHPKVIAAIRDQLDRIEYAHTSFFTSAPAEALAERLSESAPGGRWRVFFVSGGSEATEAALKLARQIQVERGEASRDTFIARHFSYHGNTLGALSVSGNAARRALYGPVLPPNVRHIDPVHAYRYQREGEPAADYGLRAARLLEQEIEALGPGRAISFIAEPVVGATLGCAPAVPGYFKEIRRICDDHGVVMILDEVMCGMGRTGTLFACEQDGVVPDMITLAKGLGAGYQPIGALLVREDLVQVLEAGSGAFQHGHTYVGHPVACAAALAVQEVMEEEGLVARVAAQGLRLRTALAERFGGHPNIGDIRGRGLFLALEVVEDRGSKRPFPAARGISARVKAQALENGLICYPTAGAADGVNGDHILLAPPYIITDSEISEIADKLDRSLGQVLSA